jgi:hypothetical protein
VLRAALIRWRVDVIAEYLPGVDLLKTYQAR